MADCPKCRARMKPGFFHQPDIEGRVIWMDGGPSFSTAVIGVLDERSAELRSRRCTECALVEFFVEMHAKPIKTLTSFDEENERLRSLVTKLQERVATLETIATDAVERTVRDAMAKRRGL